MNVLENSPLDTLAFNHLSFNFFNNLWTWLAVIFWKIRTPKPELLASSSDTPSDKPDPVMEVLESSHDDTGPAHVHGNSVVEDVDRGVTKGKMKFTLYYHEDDGNTNRECKRDETLRITEECEERDGRLVWWESWEKLLRTRTGENENGWYTCQDLTVINGSVVRFWDEGFEFATFANGGIK